MVHRQTLFLALTALLATAPACGDLPDTAPPARQNAVLGVDSFLYLLCNATSTDVNDRSRLVESAPGSGLFNLSYDVTLDWMVTGSDSCSVVETNQRNGWGTSQTRYAFRSGQSATVVVPDARQLVAATSSSFQVRYPFKGRFNAAVNWANGTFSVSATVLPQRSLFERNEAALTKFSVAQTFTSIASNGGVSGGTAWHDALFKTLAQKATFPGEAGPFCDSDPTQTAPFFRTNDFIVACSGNASTLVGRINDWKPLSVSNRFDLAPEGGENCGEARASFFVPTRTTSPTRAFMIFEAVVPNPNPAMGLDGCRAVQNFWAGLSVIADPAARGMKLAQAFYTGEPSLTAAGFKPFFTFQNFGPGKGRVRTESLGGERTTIWDFREFRLLAGGTAVAMPVAQSLTTQVLSSDPQYGEHPKAAGCRTEWLNRLATLIPANFNALGIDVMPSCFDGASTNGGTRLEEAITQPARATFASALEAKAREISPGSTLTATQLAARTEFSGTCIGCHFRPNTTASRDLGQGLMLPVVTLQAGDRPDDVDFTQVNNLRREACASDGADAAQTTCFKLSPVLGGIFLPARKTALESYLRTPVGTYRPPAAGQVSARTVGGAPNARGNP